MAHQEQIDFCKSVKKQHHKYFYNQFVLDIGSLDINGNNQYLFDDCLYIGIDLLPGKNVDLAVKAHELKLPDQSLDVIISTECFEHDQFYGSTLKNIIRMLKPGGLFIFSCATTNRPEHGTKRTTPFDAPFTQEFGEWGDYYKNLEESDIRQELDIDSIFENYLFSVNLNTCDLYFWGIKKGTHVNRFDYSFQINQTSLRADLRARELFITNLTGIISERDAYISDLDQSLVKRDRHISDLGDALADRDRRISNLDIALDDRDRRISDLDIALDDRDRRISDLDIALDDRDRRISDLGIALADRDRHISDLNQALAEQNMKVVKFISSNSWRLTKPIRFSGRILRGEFKTAFAPISSAINQLRITRYIIYIITFDFTAIANRLKLRKKILTKTKKEKALANIIPNSNKKLDQLSWGIMVTPHTLFIAHLIAEQLKKHNWDVKVFTETPDQFECNYYIVICPQMFKKLPPGEKRIAFQMEQSVSSRWFTDNYLEMLNNSLAVLEYALVNIDFMAKKGIAFPHIHYLPVGSSITYENSVKSNNKNYDVLFYGDSNSSPRRREMLEELSQHFKVLIVNDVFGHEILELIKQSHLVINLHYYENALLEMPRIQECLSLGVPIVSESAQDQNDYPELTGAVHFFEQGSIPAMLTTVKQALENPVTPEKITTSVKLSNQRFEFMFDRFLLALGFLSSSYVKQLSIPLPSSVNRVGLSLPETIGRRRVFESEKPLKCNIFDGIRRSPGWVGCGLSYVALANFAIKQGLNRLTVMEDDVILPPDFESKMVIINEYLDTKTDQWDVFAGVIASLHINAKVVSVEVYKGVTFVTINKMTSMVFNIYHKKALHLLASWNPENLDAEFNTIDRFLENQSNLRVVVTLPFFVGHREEVHSTLWGFQNDQYNDMINESEKLLKNMVIAHEKNQLENINPNNKPRIKKEKLNKMRLLI
jgi:GR25 family glycosyltransferase involved in LPS biosynthesis/SAM-dependent methyltransferase